jgi:hypothetical protein
MRNTILLFILFFPFYNCFSQNPFYPTEDASGFSFGNNVDVYNSDVLVSSSSMLPDKAGKVYLFKLTNEELLQTDVFYPTDALTSDNFGASISIQNDFIAIGSPNHDANSNNSGAVYLYKRANNIWELIQKITAIDASAEDHFGSFVKIHNNQLFVSAIDDEENGQNINTNSGAVYIYTLNGNEFEFSNKLISDSPYKFGNKIEAENNTIVISSGDYGKLPTDISYFNIYQWNDINWVLTRFGEVGNLEENVYDFSLSNNQIYFISDHLGGNDSVSIMPIDNPDWLYLDGIFEIPKSDQIHTKIKVNGDKMFIGSNFYILAMESKFPLLYYQKVDTNWIYQKTFYGTGPYQDDYFGSSIACQGNTLIIGAPGEGYILSYGKAYYINTTNLTTSEFVRKQSSIYPNPTQHSVFIKNNSENLIVKIGIQGITGNLLFTEDQDFEQLSLDKLSSGIYFMKLYYNNGNNETHKIIKK